MIPVCKDKEYTAPVTAVSSDGNGIARVEGFAVFVPRTAIGDTVRFKIEKVQKRYAVGRLIELISPSPDRCAPECAYYENCGGCRLRHITYKSQLEIKKKFIESSMQRIGGFSDFMLDEIIGMKEPKRYRNKMIFHVGGGKCGFFAEKSHSIIPIEDCAIGIEENGSIIAALSDFNVEEIFVRKAFSTDEVMVAVSAKSEIKNTDALVEAICGAAENLTGIIAKVNGRSVTLWGKNSISEVLCGIRFEISTESFFQVNPVQTVKLYEKALEFAALTGKETVMDIYCGIGTISLCAAKRAKSIIGVEAVKEAVEDARKNAENNGIKNAVFYDDLAHNIVPELIEKGETPDVVILDPPRAGSDEMTLSAIVKAAPERIVYVSCDSATLARDARFLADRGYYVSKSCGVDMFPHTTHVETVLLLSQRKS